MASVLSDDIRQVKVILLLIKGGTVITKKHILRISNLEQKSIDVLLKNYEHDLDNAMKKKRITTKQMQILFPGRSTPTDLESWDISLLSYILINLFDSKLEGFEKVAIKALRDKRNDMAHLSSTNMSEVQFLGEWGILTMVLLQLSKRLTMADQDEINQTVQAILIITDFNVATNELKSFEGSDEIVNKLFEEQIKSMEQKLTECCNRLGELEASYAELEASYAEQKSVIEIMARVLVSAQTTFVKDKAHAKLLETLENIVSRIDNRTEQQGQSVADEVHNACINLVADMRGQGVDITKVDEGSILVTIRCQTISALMNISTYFANRRYGKRLIAIEQALSNHVESNVKLDMNIILETLYSALTQIENLEKDTENKSVALTLTCKGKRGLKNATDLFGNGSPSNALKILSEALSSYVGEPIVLHSTIDVEYKQQLSLVDENKQTTKESRNLHKIVQGTPVVATAPKNAVAAIDFGTTYSGYAMSLRSDFIKDPLKIVMNNVWHAGQIMTLKTPSCILFRPDQSFHSFGYEAEDYYAELCVAGEHEDWFYFKRFKMLLFNKKLNRSTMLRDDKGLVMPAMKVFSEGIRFLRNHLIRYSKISDVGLHENDILWVLTVPAIWDDTAKQFMREAAINAGITTSQLSLALEPEVASIYCMFANAQFSMVPGHRNTCFDPGNRYLVLDAGGGTVDITVHETQDGGTVRELYKANGGPWGGTQIDETFLAFLTDITGNEDMEFFRRNFCDDFLDLMREFEVKKRTITTDLNQKVTLKKPMSLLDMPSAKGEDFRSSLVSKKVAITGGKLRLQPEQFKAFFTETCDNIVSHLKDIFNKVEVRGTDTILMVGGFSESQLLQDAVKRAFPDKKTIIPFEADLAVLKGAVIFGHRPTLITSRVARFTYGVQIVRKFDPRQHPFSKMITIDGTEYCNHCFDKHLEKGQKVDDGLTYSEEIYIPTWRSQTSNFSVRLMVSDIKDPCYTDEQGCYVVGTIDVCVSGIAQYEKRVFNLKYFYGGTEVRVEAEVRETGQVVQTSLGFLA